VPCVGRGIVGAVRFGQWLDWRRIRHVTSIGRPPVGLDDRAIRIVGGAQGGCVRYEQMPATRAGDPDVRRDCPGVDHLCGHWRASRQWLVRAARASGPRVVEVLDRFLTVAALIVY
jgi:hypothetical protein